MMVDRKNTTWTPEEDAVLEEFWGSSTPQYIAKKLGRTTVAVIQRVKLRKLGSFTSVGVYINRYQAAQMVGIDYKVFVRNWEVNHGLCFKKKRVRSDVKTQYLIKLDDFIEWLEEHQDLWDSRRVEPYALGYEPEWLVEKRFRDSKNPNKLRGTKYTPKEDALIITYLKLNKTQKEIGEILGRSEASVNSRIMRLDVWGTGKLKKGCNK